MPKFNTDAERMRHKQGKLIPASMWHDNQLFYESLDDNVITLMKAKKEDLNLLSNKVLPKLKTTWLKKQAWLGIALSHPDLDLSKLQELATTLKFDNKTLFSLFATLGNPTLLSQFTSQFASDAVLEMVAHKEFYSYKKASENGHLDILKYLEAKAPDLIPEMIMSDNFSSYRDAARNGHIEVLKYLETKAPDLIPEMMKAHNFYAYKIAGSKGNIEVLQHLETQAPSLVREMIEADHFYAYCKAIDNGHLEISNWLLLRSSACFAYAEMHTHEYGERSIKPFIKQRLAALHVLALNLPPQGVFNLSNPEQAKICFYMLRNIIRRNDRAFDDEIRFLLNIPAVKAIAHQEITAGQSNELLRLALTSGNQEAASILLNLPAVSALAEQNNFYRAEVNGRLNLAQLARDRESSMISLTTGEQKRLDAAIQHYRPKIIEQGVLNLMNALRQQLVERYEKNPATLINAAGVEIVLPMDFAELQQLALNEVEYKQALTAYYQHKDHTAWRYIARPNPWMNPDASYIYIDRAASARWSTFKEYRPLIVMFWLAACDETVPPTEDYTLESRLDHFIEELALIGRSHNWDNTRINAQGKEEEYDDLTGDRPSCFSGVKRRLFQSVLGHPLITLLTEDMINEEIRDYARNYFQSKITSDNKNSLKEAFEDYVTNINGLSEESKTLLLSLNIPAEIQHEFERYLVNKYGAQYADDFHFCKLVGNKLRLDSGSQDFFNQSHALMLDGVVGLYQMLNISDEQTMVVSDVKAPEFAETSHSRFFKVKQDEESPAPIASPQAVANPRG